MAAPATHIVLLNKLKDKYFSDKDQSALFVGTSFPDIRYLGVINRDKTHLTVKNLKEVMDESSFLTGLKFHSLVDQVREEYMLQNDIYSFFEDSLYTSQAIKVFEDQILYEKIENWSEIAKMFDVLYPEEKEFGINVEEIKRWHLLLQNYLVSPPSDVQTKIFIDGIGREGMSDEIVRVIQNIKNVNKVKEIINRFYYNFDSILVNLNPIL